MKPMCALVLSATVISVAGCGSGRHVASGSVSATSTSASTSTRLAPGTISVTMKNIAFNPETIHAKVGDTVRWTNRDADTPHNVTYVSGPKFSSSPTFRTGSSWTLKLTTPGVINYRCTIHPGMDGSIVVVR
jgi:plastocyanin